MSKKKKKSSALPGLALIRQSIRKLTGRFEVRDMKKFLLLNLPYLFVFLLSDRASLLYRLSPGNTAGEKILYVMEHSDKVLGLMPSLNSQDIMVGIGCAVVAKLLIWQKQLDSKKLRKGIEYGSARWGTPEDIRPYQADDPWMNIPLTATESLTMESRPKNPKYARNKNILVIGGSGSGKTRFFVKPSVMQMNCSYVLTDPKGTLIGEVGRLLKRGAPKRDANGNVIKGTDGKPIYQPYVIKVLNTINFSKSLHYNPFAYIKSEKDILKLVTVIMANTKGEGEKENQDFWYKAERLLYTALIAYIWYEGSEEEKNFSTLLDLLNESEVREDDEEYQNPGDWKKFTEEAKEFVNMVYEKAPEEIKQIIKKVLWALLKQMNVPNEEARELMGEIGGRGMGILFEHAEKMDIQAERRNTAREKERADAAEKRADAAETELAVLREKLARLEAEK